MLLMLIIFIQVGYTYWLSVAVLSASILLIRLRHQLIAGFKSQPWVPFIFLLMFLPLIFERSVDFDHDFLRSGREALFGILMLLIVIGSRVRPLAVNMSKIAVSLGVVAAFLLTLVIIQIGALKSGVYFGLPEEAYAFGDDTIPGALDLIYSDIRPAATFSEPSYLAFICTSILLILLSFFDSTRRMLSSIVIVISVGILSRAASFVVFGGGLSGIFVTRIVKGRNKLLILGFLALGAVATILIQATLLDGRLNVVDRVLRGGSSTGDASVFDRFFGPMYLMPEYLPTYPLGLPSSLVQRAISAGAAQIGTNGPALLMNGFFNLLFQYGFSGFIIALAFLVRRDIIVSIYLMSCMMFNGAFFAVDKFVVISMTITIYHAIISRKGGVFRSATRRTEVEMAFPKARLLNGEMAGARLRSEKGS
ncbi:hypothetical protein QUC32_24545 [Novosphingobium resinovorum]|uniref:hypothetical protein n=1 Tax=Novosphingobium TaxID=165696 RepID=UPI001B3C718A|nr:MULTISPECIES: hypothetical protein [Novosphingobium]MBF7012799.1 hypothetical protein [Novosphingobium sp. HR1a]WJM27536.1 hypothetical protein QUC32_24545 [Novosphingobium resinovorum]